MQIVSSHNENNYTNLCFICKSPPRDFFSILLEDEVIGVRHRMQHFYLPLFHEFCRVHQLHPARVRVLDCGCGNGVSVECLRQAGFWACGIDAWELRCEQWKVLPRLWGSFFCQAEATRLPFADACFDMVFSCGLLEHIGVTEWADPRYHVVPRADQAELRRQFVVECLRVLRNPGALYIDHPNGAFPVDFWHNDNRGRPRFHRTSEKFLPTFNEVVRLAHAADLTCRVEALSPADHFTFRRASRRWYGALFKGPLQLYFKLLRYHPFSYLATSALNPYLVLRITRH